MNIGIPKERHPGEERVGLTPAVVGLLAKNGHTCYVESEAGSSAGFADYDYERLGAKIVAEGAELYGKSDLVLKVLRPNAEEISWMHEGQILMGLLGLVTAPKADLQAMLDRKITAVAYEQISPDGEDFPILKTVSEVAGRLAPTIAGNLLMRNSGGRGVLLNGAPGVSAGEVVILGGGVVGMNAARGFVGMGAKVFILSRDLERLRWIEEYFNGQVTTMLCHDYNIANTIRFADVVIGAVRVPGERPPILLSREMLRTMRVGAVLIDFTIDHGGCAATSRPTTLKEPTYIEEDIVHYCVPNVPGSVPRTSTLSITNAILPYVQAVVDSGPATAFARIPGLKQGVALRHGEVLDELLARSL
jgi:alanine dehydrogenase